MTQASLSREPKSYQLSAAGLHITFLDYGACLVDIRLDGHLHPLIIGFQNPADYMRDTEHLGAIAGPVANRISGGQAMLDGRSLRLEKNEVALDNHLHSGPAGLGKRFWELEEIDAKSATLSCTLKKGETGLPGNRHFQVSYSITAYGQLDIEMRATTDRPSFCNMLTHPYFNLDGHRDVRHHHLQILADEITEVSPKNVPTGVILPVENTIYNFQNPKPVLPFIDGTHPPLDQNYCISRAKQTELQKMACLSSDQSLAMLEIWSDQPGLQCYLGQGLGSTDAGLDLNGQAMRAFAGLCLEPQCWPDAPNRPDFPSIRFDADHPYSQHSRFIFQLR